MAQHKFYDRYYLQEKQYFQGHYGRVWMDTALGVIDIWCAFGLLVLCVLLHPGSVAAGYIRILLNRTIYK